MTVSVISHPNSKQQKVETDLLGIIHVYVTAPPLQGKANRAVVKELAKYFKTKPSAIFLISGEKRKDKTFRILGEV